MDSDTVSDVMVLVLFGSIFTSGLIAWKLHGRDGRAVKGHVRRARAGKGA